MARKSDNSLMRHRSDELYFQLTEDGVLSKSGQNALLHVEEAPRLEQEPALTLILLTVELIVSVKAKKLRTVILRGAQVLKQ